MTVNQTQLKEIELKGFNFLKSLGFDIYLNNIESITDIDYKILTQNGKTIFVDFQYSQNFEKYKDIRIDFISAYGKEINKNIKFSNASNIENLFDILAESIEIKKKGKIFDTNLNSILFFIYNKEISNIPDKIVLIPVKSLISYIDMNLTKLILENRLKFNSKEGLDDNFGSSFIAVSLSSLILSDKDNIFILNLEDVKNSLKKGLI